MSEEWTITHNRFTHYPLLFTPHQLTNLLINFFPPVIQLF